MKTQKIISLLSLLISLSMLTSCGGKLYSYRKTIKVKDPVAKRETAPGNTRVYMTIQEVKSSSKTNKPTSHAAIDVQHNTVYLTTKPVDAKEEASNITLPRPAQYSATVR